MEGGICPWPLPCQAGIHKRGQSDMGHDWSPASQHLTQLFGFTSEGLPLTQAEDTPNLHKVTSVNTNSPCNLERVVWERVLKAFYAWPLSLGETHKEGMKGDQGGKETGNSQAQDLPSRCYSRKGPVPTASPLCIGQGVSTIFLKQYHP